MSEAGLVIALLGSNVFWAIVVHRLINKVMAGNYGAYLQAQASAQPKPAPEFRPEPTEDLGALSDFGV